MKKYAGILIAAILLLPSISSAAVYYSTSGSLTFTPTGQPYLVVAKASYIYSSASDRTAQFSLQLDGTYNVDTQRYRATDVEVPLAFTYATSSPSGGSKTYSFVVSSGASGSGFANQTIAVYEQEPPFSFSETVPGLDYSGGVLSLSSGYVIPLSASTTDWQTAFGWGNHATQHYFDKDTDDSDDIDEGGTNLFFTQAQFDNAVNASTTIAHPGNATTSDIIMWDGSKWIAAMGSTSSTTIIYATSSDIMYTGPTLQEWLFVGCVIIFFLSLMAWRYIFRPTKEMNDN